MIIRNLQSSDKEEVEKIFTMYWTDPEFLNKLLDKLINFINQTPEFIERKYRFFVAEDNGEVVGVVGSRVAPEHMKEFTATSNPSELYIIASKYKGKGIGKELLSKILEENKNMSFTEIVLYSPDSHKESWGFYDSNGFDRVRPAIAPDGEQGQIWRKII